MKLTISGWGGGSAGERDKSEQLIGSSGCVMTILCWSTKRLVKNVLARSVGLIKVTTNFR